MATLNIFELKQRFRKSVEYLWRYRIFAGTVQVESGEISNVVDAQSFHLAIAKLKQLRTWNFTPKCPPSTSFKLRQRFRKSVEYLWRYSILAVRVYRLKVQNFKCCRCAKFSPCHCKSKITAHLKLSTQMPTLNIFELKQRFRKLVEYLWRYRIFPGTVYRLKVAKFQMLSMRKVFTLPLQN